MNDAVLTPSPIDAARTLLPVWVVWLPLVAWVASAVVAGGLVFLSTAFPWRSLRRLPPDAHWTERARPVFVARMSTLIAFLAGLGAAGPLAVGGPLSRPDGLVIAFGCQLSAALGALAASFAVQNRMVRRLPAATRLRSTATYLLLMYPGYLGALTMIWLGLGSASVLGTFASEVVVVALALGGGFGLARLLGLARRAPPRLAAALARAQASSGRQPGLAVLGIAGANACALPVLRVIGVTEGAMECLEDDELSAVLAHEVGHLGERPSLIAMRAVVSLLPPMAVAAAPLVIREGVWALVPLAAVAYAPTLLFRWYRRALERRADAAAQGSGAAYASALEKLYRANITPAVLARTASHPDLYDRLVAAGAPPTWPRPARPPSLAPVVAVLGAVAGLAFSAEIWARRRVGDAPGGDRDRLLLAVAVEGRTYDVGRLALWHANRGEYGQAAPLYAAAEAMDSENPAWPGSLALVLSYAGRCEEGAKALGRAASLDPDSPHVVAARAATARCGTRREVPAEANDSTERGR